MNTFTNPWHFSAKDKENRGNDRERQCKCINTYLPVSIYEDLFNKVRFNRDPHNGTVNTTMNLLLVKLHHELQRRNITDFTHRPQYEHFIANCVLALPSELVGRTIGGDGGRATGTTIGAADTGQNTAPACDTQQHTDVESGSSVGEVTQPTKRKRTKKQPV